MSDPIRPCLALSGSVWLCLAFSDPVCPSDQIGSTVVRRVFFFVYIFSASNYKISSFRRRQTASSEARFRGPFSGNSVFRISRSDSHGAVGIGPEGTDHPRWFGSFCAQGIFPSLVRQESRVGRKGLEGRGPIGVCLLSGVEIWLFFLTRSFLLACGSFCTS